MRKRTEITIERRRTVVVRRRRMAVFEWCAVCRRNETKLTAEGAGAFCGVSTRTIYRAIEAGSVHFNEDAEGLLWVCAASLHDIGKNKEP